MFHSFKGYLLLVSSQLIQGSASFLSNFDLEKRELNFWFEYSTVSSCFPSLSLLPWLLRKRCIPISVAPTFDHEEGESVALHFEKGKESSLKSAPQTLKRQVELGRTCPVTFCKYDCTAHSSLNP